MGARSDRAARMARASNRGNRVAAGFPIVDGETLRLRMAEYGLAARRVEEAGEELRKLRAHIVKRAFALGEKNAAVLNELPIEWVAEEFANRMAAESDARIRGMLEEIRAAGSAPYEHTMGGE